MRLGKTGEKKEFEASMRGRTWEKWKFLQANRAERGPFRYLQRGEAVSRNKKEQKKHTSSYIGPGKIMGTEEGPRQKKKKKNFVLEKVTEEIKKNKSSTEGKENGDRFCIRDRKSADNRTLSRKWARGEPQKGPFREAEMLPGPY